MKNTYTIKDLLSLLWNHLMLIIAITIIGGIAAFSFSKFVLPVKYSSHITMYVQSYTGISENAANDVNNISNSKQLVNTYMEVLKDDAVMNAVGDLLVEQYELNDLRKVFDVTDDERIDPNSIRNCLAISSVTDTSAVKIVATTRNAELAADICNDLTQVAPKYVEEAVGVGSINTIDKAKIYKTPVAPNTMKNTVLGMAAAFLIVVMVILIIDYFDNTIKESEKIAKKYDKAIIGEIQQFGEGNKKKKKSKHSTIRSRTDPRGLLTDKDVPFNVVESYKTIRANILFTAADSDKKVIAVSSSNPGEGKSTSAANLAIALAQTGSAVLLIDADMRKPVQHRTFRVKNNEGLSTLIIKKSSVEESVKSNVINNLDILPSGPLPPNPSELLSSGNFRSLLEQFSTNYDYVIIDTPPVNVVSDAMVMKDSISGIMLVIRYAMTTYEDLANCMKQIELAKVNMLGFVLNDVHHNHGANYYNYKYKYKKYGYGYGSYGYGYTYGNNPTEETKENENAD